jgi:hypothetical protein
LWSAREFAFYIKDSLEKTRNDKFPFSLFYLRSDRKNRFKRDLDEQTKIFRDQRENSVFQSLVYLRFYNLSKCDYNLVPVFDSIEEENKEIKICFNYGIPNFIRYRQIKCQLSSAEAVSDCKQKIFDSCKNLVLKYPKEMSKIFEGFVRSSILWEPYYKVEIKQKDDVEGIVNWRHEFQPMINRYSFENEPWWREEEETKRVQIITCVRNIFLKNPKCFKEN